MSTEPLTYETLIANAAPGEWTQTLVSDDRSFVTIVYDEELQRCLMDLIEAKRARLRLEDRQRSHLLADANNLAVRRSNDALAAAAQKDTE